MHWENLWPIALALPLLIVFVAKFDKVMLRIFHRHETDVFTEVTNLPDVTAEQKALLREKLHFANHNSDKWYMADKSAVDKMFGGGPLNILDLNRLYMASNWLHHEEKDHEYIYKEISEHILTAIKRLSIEIKSRKEYDTILKEQDIISRQIQITKWAAIASIASAIAALAMLYLSYLQLPKS